MVPLVADTRERGRAPATHRQVRVSFSSAGDIAVLLYPVCMPPCLSARSNSYTIAAPVAWATGSSMSIAEETVAYIGYLAAGREPQAGWSAAVAAFDLGEENGQGAAAT